MSPLVRSLLALAALLAVVNAQSNCADETFGYTTAYPVTLLPVNIPPGGVQITIPDACPGQYDKSYIAVGEKVTACIITNEQPPDISEVNPGDLSHVNVVCPDGCLSGGVVNIVQYCSPS